MKTIILLIAIMWILHVCFPRLAPIHLVAIAGVLASCLTLLTKRFAD